MIELVSTAYANLATGIGMCGCGLMVMCMPLQLTIQNLLTDIMMMNWTMKVLLYYMNNI